MFGKGNWKKISEIVKTRTASQIQTHSQKYYNRQKQINKNKRSIHDLSILELKSNNCLPSIEQINEDISTISTPSINHEKLPSIDSILNNHKIVNKNI
jgi:hypothetical protein